MPPSAHGGLTDGAGVLITSRFNPMPTHYVTLKEPLVQQEQDCGKARETSDGHLHITIPFAEPASEEWGNCFRTGYTSQVTKHFQLAGAAFLLRRVEPAQKESELANLRELVDEVNASVANAQKLLGR